LINQSFICFCDYWSSSILLKSPETFLLCPIWQIKEYDLFVSILFRYTFAFASELRNSIFTLACVVFCCNSGPLLIVKCNYLPLGSIMLYIVQLSRSMLLVYCSDIMAFSSKNSYFVIGKSSYRRRLSRQMNFIGLVFWANLLRQKVTG